MIQAKQQCADQCRRFLHVTRQPSCQQAAEQQLFTQWAEHTRPQQDDRKRQLLHHIGQQVGRFQPGDPVGQIAQRRTEQ